VRNDASRKIHRPPIERYGDFYKVWIGGIGTLGKRGGGGCHFIAAGFESLYQFIDNLRLDLRLVALDVHDNGVSQPFCHLGDAVGAADVGGRGHDAFGPKGAQRFCDPLIIDSDYNFSYLLGLTYLIDYVLNEGFAGFCGDNFGGKTGGSEAGRNDNGRGQTGGRV
jgi:hypothetical protein